MRIVGISGKAGAGKDTIAGRLVDVHGFTRLAWADPMKRFVRDLFDFTDDQVFGSIEEKGRPDPRYLRSDGTLLTPRLALQLLGTEFGRVAYPDIWVEYGMRSIRRILAGDLYLQDVGFLTNVGRTSPDGAAVVVPDCRFRNEMDALRSAGGLLVRVKRPIFYRSDLGGVAGHVSESAQDEIPDSYFDVVVTNDGTIEDLHCWVDRLVREMLHA